MLPTKFPFIWLSGFRGEDLFKSANQKQELPMAAMFVNGSGRNEYICNLNSGLSIDCSYPVSVHLSMRFQMRRLKCEKLMDDGRQVMAKNCLWQSELISHMNVQDQLKTIKV